MVRKRDRYTRLHAKRTRPKTPAPKTGWVLAELARISQVPLRTLRYYVELNLLEPSEFRGTSTRYQRRELLRLLGILRMKSEARISLAEIKRKLHALGEEQLEEWLLARPLPPAAAVVLGHPALGGGTMCSELPVHPVREAADARLTDDAAPIALGRSAPLVAGTETWQRVHLLPGLELVLRFDASPAVRRAAQSIYDEYLGR